MTKTMDQSGEIKSAAVRGGAFRLATQTGNLALRTGSLMVLGRLLEPRDFGLVGMVTAVFGVLHVFKEFGLSAVTVQRADISEAEVSSLFWLNMLIGLGLAGLCVASAPLLASFYGEPKLRPLSIAMAASFVFNAAGVQHSALLQRAMRFPDIATIDLLALAISVGASIVMALTGFGYWSLIAMPVLLPLASTIGYWLASRWVPDRPKSMRGVGSMVRFGGAVTLNGVIVYIAYNLEKALLGRHWGADALGIYGRAYQLISIPTDNLNSAVGGVAFSALSRLQGAPERMNEYFLKGYSVILGLTMPIAVAGAVFAEDLILVVLGPRWGEAAIIFRYLSPTILSLALINPLGWLMYALGMVRRSMKIALVQSPLLIFGYAVGLRYGPRGVALAYSAVMLSWVIPHICWAVTGTGVTFQDVAAVIWKPLGSSLVAGAITLTLRFALPPDLPVLVRLVGLGAAYFLAYAFILLFVMKQSTLYAGILSTIWGKPQVAAEAPAAE